MVVTMSSYKRLMVSGLVSIFGSAFLFAGTASADSTLPLYQNEAIIEQQEQKVMQKSEVLEDTTESVQQLAAKKEALAQKLEAERQAIEELNRKIAEKKAAQAAAEAARVAAEAERQRQARYVYVAPRGNGGVAVPAAQQAPVVRQAVAVNSANTYVAGQCTWYAKNRRPDLPNNLGNANTWYANAAARGMAVGALPRAGAIATTTAGAYGHVAVVDSVNGEMVTITEMNWGGPYRMNTRTVHYSNFRYIY